MDLKKKSKHGLTECESDDPEQQEQCKHNPKTERKSKFCIDFRDFDGYFVCVNVEKKE